MDFIDNLKNLSLKISKQKDLIQTEEATKNAFILPFIAALGYDVFDPSEVVPEFTSDIGTKKFEKVDYAIIKDGLPMMFFECKKAGADLEYEHASQLYRYFATTSKTRIGILTNGILYQFYSDLDESNMMDSKPFLEFNMLDIQESWVAELKKLSKINFNLEDILSAASNLKFMKETKRIFAEMLSNPSEEFVKFFLTQIYKGLKTQKVILQFTDIVKRSFNQFINDKINERLKSAMAADQVVIEEKPELISEPDEPKTLIETTDEETESFYIVKSIVREIIDINRLFIRDYQSKCNIQIDDSGKKVIIRLYYNGNRKYIGIFDDTKNETKVKIENIHDIFNYSDVIKLTVNAILKGKENTPEQI